MFLQEILHATQYYRAPTPQPNEWDGDLAQLTDLNVDTIQIRVNWRWNETRENEYTFDDLDTLFDLAEKHKKKVIVKFLLECAPQYVFDKYDGARIGPRGEVLRGGSHGAFYGGFRPCFTNPYVQERAVKFVEQITLRYKDKKHLLFWNAWNEIRNAPVEECFCPHCRAAFGKYLKNKFQSIEKLNEFYGTAEESFETIALPTMAHGTWDIYEFKKFKGGAELYNWLKFVYDAVKKHDKNHPVMAHVGCPSLFQDTIMDNCDDATVSKAVDFFGTSIPFSTDMSTHNARLTYLMLNDFMHSIDPNYLAYEIYPGLGMYTQHYDTNYDMKYKLYSALACGAKGFNYWQFRAERIGQETDCAGLARMDGTPRPVCKEVQSFGNFLNTHGNLFVNAKRNKADVAIVFDYDSSLLSAIEDHYSTSHSFERVPTPRRYFHSALEGFYRLLHNKNYNVDFVHTHEPKKLESYKVLYFPYYSMLNEKIVPYLKRFLENGGTILADEGFGFRQENTWAQPYDIACKPLMDARLAERRFSQEETLSIYDKDVLFAPFKSVYNVQNATTLLSFQDGTPALQSVKYGKGALYLFGFSIGYSYYKNEYAELEKLLYSLLNESNVVPLTYANREKVFEKRLTSSKGEIVVLFNNTMEEQKIPLQNGVVSCYIDGKVQDGTLLLPPQGITYFIEK